ncbi:hypothetical protein DFJ73DRAFT_859513 [Zopfochytrium polystomum]|nr:hypothetical protein DFJ73DRAFT_859513 [Zopfochytrium polystomum]
MAAMFAALAYHASYRALLLISPSNARRNWMIASAVALYEFGLNAADAALVTNNIAANQGTIQDASEQKLSIALILSVCALDTFFFVAAQCRIVSVLMEAGKARPAAAALFADACLRCVCFSGAVFMFYATTAPRLRHDDRALDRLGPCSKAGSQAPAAGSCSRIRPNTVSN